MAFNQANLLAVILEVNPVWWGQLIETNPDMSFSRFVDYLITFCNAHLMLNSQNKLCLIVSLGAQNRFVFPRCDASDKLIAEKCGLDGRYERFSEVGEIVRNGIKEFVLNDSFVKLHTDCVLTGALEMALCYINKINNEAKTGQKYNSKLLVIKASMDNSLQYMDFMSIIFTAQKMGVTMDSCILDNESNFLKQGCDILGGIYLKLPQIAGFLEYLLYVFLPSQDIRHKLTLPSSFPASHKAACFCHRTPVDIGYVCSVCLSIFCNFYPICPTCQSNFKVNLRPKPANRKHKA